MNIIPASTECDQRNTWQVSRDLPAGIRWLHPYWRPTFCDATLTLLACAVVARGLPQLLDIRCRKFRSVNFQRQLIELAGELEWDLVIVRHWRTGVRADIEVLVPLQTDRNRALHGLACHLLAIDFQRAGAAAADAAHVVEGER